MKRAAAPAIEPRHVTINWAFFDKSQPYDKPLPIHIPLQEFKDNALSCLPFFVAELLKHVKFRADPESVDFLKVCISPPVTYRKLTTTLAA